MGTTAQQAAVPRTAPYASLNVFPPLIIACGAAVSGKGASGGGQRRRLDRGARGAGWAAGPTAAAAMRRRPCACVEPCCPALALMAELAGEKAANDVPMTWGHKAGRAEC